MNICMYLACNYIGALFFFFNANRRGWHIVPQILIVSVASIALGRYIGYLR